MVCFLSVSMAHADWPRFRGENGTGIAAADAKPPLKWSSSEGMLWKAELPGAGASSPIIVGDKVFVTTYSTQFNATPAVDGNRLYLRSDKTLYCVGQ